MSDLVRFGVAMDRALLEAFDARIAGRGYENRSEALRDLVRADLTRAAWDGGALVAATLTVVYANQVRDVMARLTEAESAQPGLVSGSLRVPLGPERTLEVTVLRGAAADLSAFAGRIAGARGVLACELTLAAPLREGEAAPRRP